MKTHENFFVKNYFSKKFPLEYRIYMIFFFEALLISVLSATTNTLLGKGILGVVLQWAVIAVCIVMLFIPVEKRMAAQKPFLLFITFLYIPFLFFQTAGYYGTALLFSLLAIFMLSITFRGKARIAAVALNIAVFVGCCFIEFFNPGLIVPHATEADMLIDLVVALVLSTVGLAIMAVYISKAYVAEHERIKTLMNEDVLTGAYARRYLHEQLPREMSIAQRSGRPLSIVMFDLDFFKKINDTYGHSFGDEVLHAVAQAVMKQLRPYDILARYGGEEFVVVLPGTTHEKALKAAERLRLAAEACTFENGKKVTISLGVAQYHTDETFEQFIERADTYLYKAKEAGRNQSFGQA